MARPQLPAAVLAALLLSTHAPLPSLGFVVPVPSKRTSFTSSTKRITRIVAAEKSSSEDDAAGGDDQPVAGSFFNPVPESSSEARDGDDEGHSPAPAPSEASTNGSSSTKSSGTGGDEFEKSLAKLMRTRKAKPRASTPSTLGGVPTSQATGFGKPTARVIKASNKSGTAKNTFVGIGKPLNDVNNPEYDDQGYTLYADEETGQKSRVFEALVDYPCSFTMKIVGANEGGFEEDIVRTVAESCGVEVDKVPHKARRNGKWTSVTVEAPVESAEMLYALYESIDRDPRVKFKF